MITLTNYSSGDVSIEAAVGPVIRLPRAEAHRLIMAARMSTPSEFLSKLETLIPSADLCRAITAVFEGQDRSKQWQLKEAVARLTTLSKGYESSGPTAVVETVQLDESSRLQDEFRRLGKKAETIE